MFCILRLTSEVRDTILEFNTRNNKITEVRKQQTGQHKAKETVMKHTRNHFWRRLFKLMPKKKIYIEGNLSTAPPEQEQEMEILEGEETPVRVYFDENSEYEIIEQEISPAKIPCPNCKRRISHGMDYCNFCGAHVTEKVDNDE